MANQTVVAGQPDEARLRAAGSESWLLGFHGALLTAHLDADGPPPSLRSIALAHRSLGTQRLSVLTELERRGADRSVPRGRLGARPVGTPADVDAPAAGTADPALDPGRDPRLDPTLDPGLGVAPATPIKVRFPAGEEYVEGRATVEERGGPDSDHAADDPWDEVEPLDDYLDRRLLHARVLYLPNRSRAYRVGKRLLDILGASVLLLLSLPVLLVLAVVIRLDSPGPALFRHHRVTLGGRLFVFYKFRTMWVDARDRFPELYDYHRTAGDGDVYYKLEDDPRNTRVGRWLRRTTLDELPNLINVLKGDMSLVGPRPELPQLLSHYRPEDLALFFTKAGVTGLAQVAGRSLLTVRERIRLDLRYVAQQTLLLDVRILLRTVAVVLVGRGAF